MKVEFRNSFAKDLRKTKNSNVLKRVKDVIERIEQTEQIGEIKNLKKLRGGDYHYRIRVGNYRIGLIVKSDTVSFVRFLHRKDIYKHFP